MKNYIKPTLLALLISTACVFAKDEAEWKSSHSPMFFVKDSGLSYQIKHLATSADGQIIYVLTYLPANSLIAEGMYFFRSRNGGLTWDVLTKVK
jgi:hypothetical protein